MTVSQINLGKAARKSKMKSNELRSTQKTAGKRHFLRDENSRLRIRRKPLRKSTKPETAIGAEAPQHVIDAMVLSRTELREKYPLEYSSWTLKTHKRYLSGEEFSRLGEELKDAEAEGTMLPSAVQAVRLLLLTGCRLGEVLSLKWAFVDFENGWLNLPTSKTGPKIVYLNSAAVDVQEPLPEFPARNS